MCTLLGRRLAPGERFATESMRDTVIATVLAPAGTLAATAMGAEDEDVTFRELTASGAGAARGAVACLGALTAGAFDAVAPAAADGGVGVAAAAGGGRGGGGRRPPPPLRTGGSAWRRPRAGSPAQSSLRPHSERAAQRQRSRRRYR